MTSIEESMLLLFNVDFEKAFDSVNWNFLLDVMRKMGFGTKCRNWIASVFPRPLFRRILSVGVSEAEIEVVASSIGCAHDTFPFSYLGVPGVVKVCLKDGWNAIIDHFRYRLLSWKGKSLSIGGGLTLIKYVIGSLQIYYLSLFKARVSIINNLETIREFRIGSLHTKNLGLLCKWKSRFLSEDKALWRMVIKDFYGDGRGFISDLRNLGSGVGSIWNRRNKIVYAQLDDVTKIKEEDIFPAIQRLSMTWIYASMASLPANKPTLEDVENIYDKHVTRHGFPGMLGSIDCMHWEWKNCPIWHAFFGVAGANNDINVLDNSLLFDDLLDDKAHVAPYVVNGVGFKKGYYLADGIYPQWATFVKSFTIANDAKHAYDEVLENQLSSKIAIDMSRGNGYVKKGYHYGHVTEDEKDAKSSRPRFPWE
ncbi:ALP1-like protein [Tanacetum coccineum]